MAAKRKKKVPVSRAKLKPKRKLPRRTKPDKLRGRSIKKASASRSTPERKKKKQKNPKRIQRASASIKKKLVKRRSVEKPAAKRRSVKKSIRKGPIKRKKIARPIKRRSARKPPRKRTRAQAASRPVPPRRRAGTTERSTRRKRRVDRIPLKQLEAERPQLKTFAERLIAAPWRGNTRTILNNNQTIDSEAKIERPIRTEAADFVFQIEQVYWMVVSQFPGLHGTWLKLGAIFNRDADKWLTYELPIFRGKEAVIMNYSTTIENAAEYWVDFRAMISHVLNAYLTPDRRGQARPAYTLTHVLIRLHRGIDPPLY